MERKFPYWLAVVEGQPVKFGDLPVLMANALHPSEEEPLACAFARHDLEKELPGAVDAGTLIVRNASGLGVHTFPIGEALRQAVVLPWELRPFLEARGIELREIPHGSGLESSVDTEAAPVAYKAAEGITKEQVLIAFDSLVKSINLKKALGNGKALFGDSEARTQKGTRGGKHAALWNPVILALGLNEKYSVPMPHLKRAFSDHSFLRKWVDEWNDKLDLLGE